MDVEMQMESKGLPTQFGTTSDQPEDRHAVSKVAASISNSETSSMPQPEPKQTLAVEDQIILPLNPTEPEASQQPSTLPAPDGISYDQPPPVATEAISESMAAPSEPEPMLPFSATAQSVASFNDSGISSSAPASSDAPMPPSEPTQSTMETLPEPAPIIQPPTSDLRTLPHADELTPAEVAEVEAEKHKEDNAAEAPFIPELSAAELPPAVVPESSTAPAALVAEATKINETGLATPPTQTPPPAPQPEHAVLPQDIAPPAEPEVPALAQAIAQEQPVELAPTPVVPAPQLEDQEMTDVPTATKVAREREDDQDEVEPASKRMKTDEDTTSAQTPDFKVPDMPAASSPQTNGSPAPAGGVSTDGDDSVTQPRLAHMKKVISNLKKSNASTAFRVPVDYKALNIPTYPDIINTPMDLGTIDTRLKQNQYNTVTDFVNDFELIVANCVTFNGREHAITQAAMKMQNSFNNQMAHLPKAAFAEPSREEKKAAKMRQEPTRQAPPRRPSVSTSQPPTVTARSPQAATPSTPFAPGPDGVPLIRRDSNVTDGRPKRAIVPPKRNQDFAGGRPKKKKYELQLKFCQEVLKELAAPKNWQLNQFFTHPVDPVALNIPTYFQIIKKPMDFETIQTKLTNNVYEKAKEFEEDVHLVFKNCYKFNPESDWVNQAGHQLEEMFEKKWATKDEWIASREPQSEPQTEEDEDEEEETEDEDDSEAERNDKIAALQKQIAEMSKQMGELTQKKPKKKSKSPSAPPKKSKSKSSKKEKPKTTFPGLQKPTAEKKKSISKPKPDRYVTFSEKQYISNGIAMLPEKQMQEALKIIQQSVPSLANSAENEIELDIEEVPNHALLRLLNFVKKYAGPPPDEPKADSDSYSTGAVGKSKKNKPNRQEQEAHIEALRGQLGAYNGGPVSPNAVQSIEQGDSSDDEGDSEESEEE